MKLVWKIPYYVESSKVKRDIKVASTYEIFYLRPRPLVTCVFSFWDTDTNALLQFWRCGAGRRNLVGGKVEWAVTPHGADHIDEGKKIVKLLMVLSVLFKDTKVQIHYWQFDIRLRQYSFPIFFRACSFHIFLTANFA